MTPSPLRSLCRSFLAITTMITFAAALPSAHAQSYPTGPIKVVVPFPAGSGVDGVARAVIARMATGLGQAIVIDNRGGAGGNIGTEFVARAPKDGYTLLFNATQLVGNPGISAVKYDAVKDFAPISLVSRVSAMLVVPPDSPANTVQDLIAMAKAKPGGLSYASGGNGGIGHYSGELLKSNGGNLNIVHIPYKSAAEQVTSVMTGQTQLAFPALQIAQPQVKAGKLKALAVTGARRSGIFPEVPTMQEAMRPGFTLDAWYGLLAPAGTPAAVIERLHAELVKVLADPAVRQSLIGASQDVVGSTPAEFAEVIAQDLKLWTDLAVKLGVKAD
jgi:tripartite-type tricarboxylate transporter receptor subunit TctC